MKKKYQRILMQDLLISKMKPSNENELKTDQEINTMIKEAEVYSILTRMNQHWYWLAWYKVKRFFERIYESIMIIYHG